jgi:hypothetical protein
LLLFLEIPIQKGRKLYSEKTEKTWRERKRLGNATFLLHLANLTGPTLNGHPEIEGFKAGRTGENLGAPSESG